MEKRRLIAVVIALGALSLGVLTACGGGTDPAGTIGGEVTIGTGTNATSTPVETGGDTGAATTSADTGATTGGGEGDAAAGAAVFSANCASCHTLAAAGSNGMVGPNLDEAMPSYDLVMERVTNGQGAMPAFGTSGMLTETQIKDVAAYVSENAGK